MASAARAIDFVDLSTVWSGHGETTSEMIWAIANTIDTVEEIRHNAAPKNTAMTDLLFQIMTQRRSGSGPTSAPAPSPTAR